GAQRDALVCVHELLVGVGVAPLRAGDELPVVEWPAHHCVVYTSAASLVPWPGSSASTTWRSRSETSTRRSPSTAGSSRSPCAGGTGTAWRSSTWATSSSPSRATAP